MSQARLRFRRRPVSSFDRFAARKSGDSFSFPIPPNSVKLFADRRVVLPVTFGESRAVAYDEKDLPEGWDARPNGPASQQVGGEWAWSEESLVLRVPSVVVPMEYNYLINPKHPDFGELEFGEPRPLDPDPRLPAE